MNTPHNRQLARGLFEHVSLERIEAIPENTDIWKLIDSGDDYEVHCLPGYSTNQLHAKRAEQLAILMAA